jgi:alpha-D-xyloside xylohydrolase
MKQANDFLTDMLDFGAQAGDGPDAPRLWRAGKATGVRVSGGDLLLDIPFQVLSTRPQLAADASVPRRTLTLRVRAYGPSVVRLTLVPPGETALETSPMLELSGDVAVEPLSVSTTAAGWEATDPRGRVRLRVQGAAAPTRHWSDLLPAAMDSLDLEVLPDGSTVIPFSTFDQFFPGRAESLPVGLVTRGATGSVSRTLFSVHAEHDERFAGTGERFARLDLSGKTLVLENTDALGVNNRRAYKNVPLVVSSRKYGVFVHTSAHVRLSVADVSTRAVQAVIEEPVLDLFLVGGASLERVLYHYRCLTGFPPEVPLWSYGTWMSRMSYFSADEVKGIARRLREGGFPCDVLHIDTGWFAKDWVCEWRFSKERFPDPAGFMRELRDMGYRVTLWQNPNIGKGNALLPEARAKRYVPPTRASSTRSASDFSEVETGGQIDFTNPEAVRWYQSMLRSLFDVGVAAIKTDFGETIDMEADFQGMSAERLHNLYGLLYQRAAFEVTRECTGDGIVWARAGWAGCQRYPVHWGGDCACTWDGMAGSLRGGLHLGLSGFAYWSHDVPGFHGLPEFMNSWPADDLYVRWTQLGVFTSHLRYHGTSRREPYEFPAVADTARKWLRLRYALIPYLVAQGRRAATSGYPVLRAMIFDNEDDPACWAADDQFFCGDAFLVAPVMNGRGVRDVYLPEGEWVDLWDGTVVAGPRRLRSQPVPLERMPVYARRGAAVPVYGHRVQCTDEMDLAKAETLRFDASYRGIAASALGRVSGLS